MGVDGWQSLSEAMDTPCEKLVVSGRPGFMYHPSTSAPGNPWVFYAPTFAETYPTKRQAWIFSRLLDAGIAITGIDVGESFGSPAGRAGFDAWHRHVTGSFGLAPRAVLLPQSRGGLMLYNWAAEHPEKVAGVTGIYTVCDLRSYPGIEQACGAYGMNASELTAALPRHNPVDRLAPLARQGIPVWHIHGDSDAVVPLELNAGELVIRYRGLGGPAELLIVPGRGHEEHPAFFENGAVVESITTQALQKR
jgi:pimeloyl-ACP methyl ester carboxylesterase